MSQQNVELARRAFEAWNHVGELEGGLVRKLRAYLDPNQALEAVGLPPEQARPE